MKLLLDTHSFIWFFEGDNRLPLNARQLIADENNELMLSIASIWEMAIKTSISKLTLSKSFERVINEHVLISDIGVLNITVLHTFAVAKMPLHHRDPFDRIIIAQSLVEAMPLISGDPAFDQYGVTRLWQ
jgi:PIN domain nuclease of toxin-antitoxin system